MQKWNGSIIWHKSELIDLLGSEIFYDLHSNQEFGFTTFRARLFGMEPLFLQERFSEIALNALRDAIK